MDLPDEGRRRHVGVGPAIALSLLLTSCSSVRNPASVGPPSGGRGASGAAVPVVTARVVEAAAPVTIPAVGTVETMAGVQIRSQITGQLSAVHFSEGQDVTKGQLLFTIDPRPFEAALDQAQAVLARDAATAKNQQAELARYEDLFGKGLIARDQYETQTAAVQSSQATLRLDQAAVENAKLNLGYTQISAPMTGRTGALGIHVGELVRANDTNPMVVINQLSPIYVTFSVPGRYLEEIHHYQARSPLAVESKTPAAVAPGAQQEAPSAAAPDVRTSEGTGRVEEGRVTFIDNAVDATTGTIKLRGSFPNADHALWPGLFVQVTLTLTTEPAALVAPAAALQVSQDGPYVYVVKADRTVELRPVSVQRQQGDAVVIAKGLSAGEEVVTDGQLRLTPGARVSASGREQLSANGSRGRGSATGKPSS
jgi:membrane fusion protein, multidrug efflux system